MIEVRSQPAGVLVTDGTVENFRGWPLSTKQAAVLVQRLLAHKDVEKAWFNLPPYKEQKRG